MMEIIRFMKLDLLKKFQSSFTHRLSLSSRQPTLLRTPHPRPTLSSPVNAHVLRPSPTPPSKQQSLLFELHRAGGGDVHVRWAEHNARVEIHHAATDEALLLCPPVIRQLRMRRPPSYTHLIVLMRLAVGWLLLGCSEIFRTLRAYLGLNAAGSMKVMQHGRNFKFQIQVCMCPLGSYLFAIVLIRGDFFLPCHWFSL
ncbi:uncharacterized protein [Aegilops tauschii subsp. strangulata]|uniref:uncharacterized protein isoform X3 n=1 Tax=Aegilops tauschii subsp. strangulata TaxID=200361 RepID=UPI001ABCE792|nr:uncharacterized protein LOC109741268 isoform X2 [Aegilops tauschii subsp. strangulata]XP_045084826.1 uncharacterized protein LOC109741268 isoform X2 [Aegilops tauschii subsp. strangulata]